MRSIRKSKIGGGCAIYINKRLKASLISELTVNETFVETVFAQISLQNKNLIVGCCYRPPNSEIIPFQSFIENKISSIASGSADIVLCGDFNLDMLKINVDSNAENFYQAMHSYSMLPFISKPSRITDSYQFFIN